MSSLNNDSKISSVVEESPQGYYQRYDQLIGSGSLKQVYLGYDVKEGRHVAWCSISLKKLNKRERSNILDEVRLLQTINHERILTMLSCWYVKDRDEFIIINQLYQGGSLWKYVSNRFDQTNYKDYIHINAKKKWFVQILEGLEFLHTRPQAVLHRDIKSDNIFYDSYTGDVRIGDLSLSCFVDQHKKNKVLVGTPGYIAPELYKGYFSTKSDIYSFGMVMLELFTGRTPFEEYNTTGNIMDAVSKGCVPKLFSELDLYFRDKPKDLKLTKSLIMDILNPDPVNRPSATQLLSNSYFKYDLILSPGKTPKPSNRFSFTSSSLSKSLSRRSIKTIRRDSDNIIEIPKDLTFQSPDSGVSDSTSELSTPIRDHNKSREYSQITEVTSLSNTTSEVPIQKSIIDNEDQDNHKNHGPTDATNASNPTNEADAQNTSNDPDMNGSLNFTSFSQSMDTSTSQSGIPSPISPLSPLLVSSSIIVNNTLCLNTDYIPIMSINTDHTEDRLSLSNEISYSGPSSRHLSISRDSNYSPDNGNDSLSIVQLFDSYTSLSSLSALNELSIDIDGKDTCKTLNRNINCTVDNVLFNESSHILYQYIM